MNIATLKVHGDIAGLADVRDGLPTEPDSAWDKGDPRPDGRVRIDSGFYVGIGTDKNPDALLKLIRVYLAECRSRGIHFERVDVDAELRIAITESDPTAPTLDFSLADLKVLTEMGISLSISS
ncbi:hypothetical protein [Rugamonas sp.]|uniref:hypothetical protein n=1 Tax=Rugamonas sp. TaxID=1926287 RepID=UPI0025E29991|nr:hypothetical protein [Rugamonas sp.]